MSLISDIKYTMRSAAQLKVKKQKESSQLYICYRELTGQLSFSMK